ncbi:MAG: hypothetical protein EXR62_03695 [Chloroflexi bacterium]|nr:hypothetical protein [Chloroflexota bacterium]
MSYLVDSDIVADWLNGRGEIIQLLTSLEQQNLAISLITYGEIYEGIYYGRRPEAAKRAFLQFLRGVNTLPLIGELCNASPISAVICAAEASLSVILIS